ncbi:family 61 putative glycoside hydrolase [Rhypophila decipiens]|uniref:lytic cellulose monooxygenase (C4-dehydrogenating) n=1 Tax=Rhypophila decipiens TaxID=261697 RepID=A0AAN6Y662_9PEZI|nr:family 61 putative glycoside hydrolase [Rhypophila decipiens]
MKLNITAVFIATAQAHSTMQKISVNGVDQGQLVGLRAPNNPNPVVNVNDPNMACGQPGYRSNVVINVKAGDRIGGFWGHALGGAQWPGDPAQYIDKSHKGPIMHYMAKVDNAATSSAAGLRWFKISEESFNAGQRRWAVDNMIANNGWSYTTIPTCIAPGQYLLRVELLALHSAYSNMGAQFYQSCAQINVSSSGTLVPSQTVSIPGLYQQNDPSILIQIWVNGKDDNGGRPYKAPGPAPMTC